jgi:hypothetical protein
MILTSRLRNLLVAVATLAGVAGCVTTHDITGNCGLAANSMYRPVVTASLGSAAKPGGPTGLIIGSIGSLGDFDPRALTWSLWLTRSMDERPGAGTVVSVMHVLGASTDDFKLSTPRPGRKPAGAAVFCAALEPGDYVVHSVGVRTATLPLAVVPLPGALEDAGANGMLMVGHRFSVTRGAATYLGRYVVGSAGAEPVNVGRLILTNELDRDAAKARELGVKLDSFPIQPNVPSRASSGPAGREASPAR